LPHSSLAHPAALLIPKPREGRAQRAVYVLLATCTVALCLAGEPLSPAAHRVSAHLAALQIGALLKGCCCLAEEIFHLHYALGSTLPGVHPEGPVLLRSVKAAAPWHGHQSRTARALQG
uniref:STING transmembrane domain-containing protein n=1 Tax=Anas zonorhyncha TaxID=75864 RepID=A0A8B9VK02_9AVES